MANRLSRARRRSIVFPGDKNAFGNDAFRLVRIFGHDGVTPAEAETVNWDDLKKFPETGWALFGREKALRAQGKDEQA